jgi:hypothetical protein
MGDEGVGTKRGSKSKRTPIRIILNKNVFIPPGEMLGGEESKMLAHRGTRSPETGDDIS